MKYRAQIINNNTGESRWYDTDVDDEYVDNALWIWTEGNYGCDCNRSLFFSRAAGEPDLDVECGESRFTVPVIEWEDGRREEIDSDSPGPGQ